MIEKFGEDSCSGDLEVGGLVCLNDFGEHQAGDFGVGIGEKAKGQGTNPALGAGGGDCGLGLLEDFYT